VINTGNEDILKSYFDQNAPIGISIQNGRIIEKPELIEWSDEYLEQNFKVEYESSSSVTFSNVILEQNEFVTLKFLILHKTEETPTWHSLGKIAGQKIISINSVQDSKTETPFFEKAFYGAIGIQLARLFGYFFGLILIVVLIAIIGATLSDFFEGKKRKKWINEFIKGEEYQYNRMDDAIFERFEEDGISNFRRISYLTNDELKLNSRYNKALKELKEEKEIDPSLQDRMVIEDNFRSDWSLVNELINDGLVLKEGKKLLINNPMKQTLESFIEFLKSKGEFRKKRHHSNSRRLAIPSE
jgi:hypothetical protein